MKFTKKQAKAWSKLMKNLSEEAVAIGEKLCKELTPERFDEKYATLYEKLMKTKESFHQFDDFLVKNELIEKSAFEDGEDYSPTTVKVSNFNTVEISQPLSNGSLTAYTCVADFGTPSAGVVYESSKGSLLDIAYAEQKKGELAKNAGLPEDNEDIDVYVYGEPQQEDITNVFRLTSEAIRNALKEEES